MYCIDFSNFDTSLIRVLIIIAKPSLRQCFHYSAAAAAASNKRKGKNRNRNFCAVLFQRVASKKKAVKLLFDERKTERKKMCRFLHMYAASAGPRL